MVTFLFLKGLVYQRYMFSRLLRVVFILKIVLFLFRFSPNSLCSVFALQFFYFIFFFTGESYNSHKCSSDQQQHQTNCHPTCSSNHTTARPCLYSRNLRKTSSTFHLLTQHNYHHSIAEAHKVLWSHDNFSCDVCLFVQVLQSTPGACDLCSDLWCIGLKV